MPYSVDFRKRAVALVHQGMSQKKVYELLGVCKQTLSNWLNLEKNEGHLNPITGFQKGHSHGIKDLAAFKDYVDAHPDQTQEEIARYFKVGSSTISRNLQKIEYSRKKRVKLILKESKKKEESTWKK